MARAGGRPAERWRRQVEAHHRQSLRARGSDETGDFWRPFARHFLDDPWRTDDPVLNRLLELVPEGATVLDVGGGAGRFALPLALRGRGVTVVEPSEAMLEALQEGVHTWQVPGVTAVHSPWEEADVEPHDFVLCAHVLYGVAEVVPFVQKLSAAARRQVLVLMFMDWPQAHLSPFWRAVHGERRVSLPALREFLPLLWELGVFPDLEMFPPSPPPVFEDLPALRESLMRRLYVRPGTEQERRLDRAMRRLLVPADGGWTVRGAGPRRQGMVRWVPG